MQEDENKGVISNLIAEYEDVIHALQLQLEMTRIEHKNLKEEIVHLIAENQNLTTKLDEEYKERMRETLGRDFSEGYESEIVINLQSQLDLCIKEKEKVLELYKTSLKLIEKLEEEISSQQENLLEKSQSKVSITTPAVRVLEAKLKTAREHLEIATNARDQLESENVKYQTKIAKLNLNLESNNKIIEQLKSREEEWKNKCTKLDQDYTLLNATFECVIQSRNEMEKKLDLYSVKIQELMEKNNESRNKVEEAVDIAEKALAEKESSAIKEQQLTEEIAKLKLCLEHVIEEAGKKVGTEVEETKKKFDSNLQQLLTELSEVKSELEKKKLEHKRISFKYKKLEKLASAKLDKEKISLIKGSEAEITILENHLDSVYQELERFKVKYEELGREKNKLEDEFSGLIEKHSNLMRDKESREAFLEEAINELKSQIDHKVQDLNEAVKRSEFFIGQVRDLQAENKELKKSAANCNCDRLKARIQKLNQIREAQRVELESHVESQMKLNETWRREIKEMTEKFEERMRECKKECSQLKAKNKRIVSELNTFKKKFCPLENV